MGKTSVLLFLRLLTIFSAMAAIAMAAPSSAPIPPPVDNSNTTTSSTAAAPSGSPPPAAAAAAPPPDSNNNNNSKASSPPPAGSTSPPPAGPPSKSSISTPPPESAAAPAAAAPPPSSSSSKNKTSTSPPPVPSPAQSPPPASAPSPAIDVSSELDPSQIAALQALKVNFSESNPCTDTPSDVLMCSSSTTSSSSSNSYRHLIALSLLDCPASASLTTKALSNLSSLHSLHLEDCPLKPVTVPSSLIGNLTAFTCIASLGRTGANHKLPKLSGAWLSKLVHLQKLHVTEVQLDLGDGLFTVTQNLGSLTELTLARGSYAGVLPRNTWPNYIQYIDVSGNSIRGTVPSQMGALTELEYLDLSGNQLRGELPEIFGGLSKLQHLDLHGNRLAGPLPVSLAELRNLSHLDLSNNLLNGSIWGNLSRVATLRYLDLSQNEFTGPIPFNASFLSRLTRLNLDNNQGLCYNHSNPSLRAIKALATIPDCAPSSDLVFFAPAPSPAAGLTSGADGPRRLSAAASVGVASAVIVVVAALSFVGFRWWKSRQSDRFLDLGASQHKL